MGENITFLGLEAKRSKAAEYRGLDQFVELRIREFSTEGPAEDEICSRGTWRGFMVLVTFLAGFLGALPVVEGCGVSEVVVAGLGLGLTTGLEPSDAVKDFLCWVRIHRFVTEGRRIAGALALRDSWGSVGVFSFSCRFSSAAPPASTFLRGGIFGRGGIGMSPTPLLPTSPFVPPASFLSTAGGLPSLVVVG